MTILEETEADFDGIDRVNREAFGGDGEASLVRKLRENDHLILSLVAKTDSGEIVGHIAYSPLSGHDSGAGLAPLSVLPGFQKSGIGTQLVRASLPILREHGIGFVVVLGEPEYYSRFGFERADERGLQNEYGAGPAFRVLELRPDGLEGVAGLIRYAPEFGEL
ncbi:MAG: N-acetyltransferase [Verrucomicrobiales bacterium]|nr:N-acetyltransferase [Verrucomicrobiales bacterium]